MNDLTFEIPINASSTIELDSAEKSCACFDNFLINRPKNTAIIAITGTVATIINANFQEINNNKMIDPIIVMTCLKNSAMVVRKVSCTCEISAEILLVNSPTLF